MRKVAAFLDWMEKKVKNPETGNVVKVKSLPERLRDRFKSSQTKNINFKDPVYFRTNQGDFQGIQTKIDVKHKKIFEDTFKRTIEDLGFDSGKANVSPSLNEQNMLQFNFPSEIHKKVKEKDFYKHLKENLKNAL